MSHSYWLLSNYISFDNRWVSSIHLNYGSVILVIYYSIMNGSLPMRNNGSLPMRNNWWVSRMIVTE